METGTKAAMVERRERERRAAHGIAAARYCASVDQRMRDRRKADADSVGAWLAAFDRARGVGA